MPIALATQTGIVLATREASGWREAARALPHENILAIAATRGAIIAGTRAGIFRSTDSGATFHAANDGLTTRHIRWLTIHPDDSARAFAGTEGAGIFISRDAGATWRECPEVARLRDLHRWSLPYSPGAGCVRGLAFNGARAYAAVEVGGVLISDDRGETWRLADGSDGKPRFGAPKKLFVHPDVHSIATHPASPDLVYAPSGGGFYRSRDGGKSWELKYDCYCRAVWVDPQDAEHLILGPADNVDEQGRIEETRDGGATWRAASNGLRAPWKRHMVERFLQVDDELFAVLSNGELIATPLASLEWRGVFDDVKDAAAIAIL